MEEKLQAYVLADAEKCVGCKACELACFAEHNQKENRIGKTVGTVSVPVTPRLFVTRTEGYCMPIQCRHCEDAPCLQACALHAIERIDNQIVIHQEKCSGCKDCMLACPFGAIAMQPLGRPEDYKKTPGEEEIRKAAFKCDLCIENDKGPACVRACPNDALRIVHANKEAEEKRIKAAEILARL